VLLPALTLMTLLALHAPVIPSTLKLILIPLAVIASEIVPLDRACTLMAFSLKALLPAHPQSTPFVLHAPLAPTILTLMKISSVLSAPLVAVLELVSSSMEL